MGALVSKSYLLNKPISRYWVKSDIEYPPTKPAHGLLIIYAIELRITKQTHPAISGKEARRINEEEFVTPIITADSKICPARG